VGAARELIEKLRRGEVDSSRCLRIPADRVSKTTSATSGAGVISSGRDYFTVTIDSLRLEADRSWAKTYDPLVLAMTDFRYDGEVRSVPFVVGAPMLKGVSDGVPAGMAYTNTLVSGPHPYYARLAVTVILYRVLREDYVRRVLDAVQRTCAAFDPGILMPYLKIADAVLDGVEALLGDGRSEAVLGAHVEFDGDVTPGTFAIVPSSVADLELWADDGALRVHESGSSKALEGTNYVTCTIGEAEPVDLGTLPWFAPLWARIVQWANIPTDEAKGAAKNYLAALYEEIDQSPDVARERVDELYAAWEKRARDIHELARKRADWGPDSALEPVQIRALEIQAS
jgi:hypothetical protein